MLPKCKVSQVTSGRFRRGSRKRGWGWGGQAGHGAPSRTHLVTHVPTHTHNKSPSQVPSMGGDQSQAAPKGLRRTLHLPLSEGKEKDSGVEATCLLSQLCLPSLNGSKERKTRGHDQLGELLPAHTRPTGRVYAQTLPTRAPYQVRGTHNQQSRRETPKTALPRMGVQGKGCSEQPPPPSPSGGAPRTQTSPHPSQPTAVPRGLPPATTRGESASPCYTNTKGVATNNGASSFSGGPPKLSQGARSAGVAAQLSSWT